MKKDTKNTSNDSIIERRKFLKTVAVGSALAVPGAAVAGMRGAGGGGGGGGGGAGGGGGSGTAFASPLSIPPVLQPVASDSTTDYYEMTQMEASVEIVPGTTTAIYGYNGITPGPTIRAKQGREVQVVQNNALPVEVSTHLHGGEIEAASDGHPTDLIPVGSSKNYRYSNIQKACTLWYHDHAVDETAQHVYRGLAGFYLLEDDEEQSLNLPSGDYEVPMVIQDRSFNADGSFAYTGNQSGELGDTILVNGVIQPFFEVSNRKYRFRVLNGSNRREYILALSNGQQFTQIGTDGGLLEAPVDLTEIFMSPAYRCDIVIDFSQVPVGTSVVLQNLDGSGSTAEIMRFDVVRAEADPSVVPAQLTVNPVLNPADAVVTRQFTFSRRAGDWVINGNPYDPNRIDANPKLDSIEIWELTNRSNMNHPVHIHLAQFQVLDAAGSQPEYMGQKDTFVVRPMATVRVIGKFSTYTGKYVFHCHNLEHEDFAMMANFEVIP
ncbi:Multicopper oxidase [hydrothermal vent metagenome]|uniref:Multicopper oxidase CueO n=1 Tax=hydrothermal vent metagenome TaxID=652676 RepID=A0A3B1A5E6_9ZZZZ